MAAAVLLLAAAALLPVTGPARAAAFIDAAGRHVLLPDRISRILPAERDAEVLVYVLAPDRLAAISRRPLLRRRAGEAVLDWGPRSTPASMAATARQVQADLIIDAGTVTPARAAFADQVQRLTGIPYILVDDSFARMPAVLRSLGAILGVGDRGNDLGLYAEEAIAGLRGRLLIRPASARPLVYFALGDDGLTTALPGSPAGETIDEAGAINVAAPLGRGGDVAVTPGQLRDWNPAIIIAQRRQFFAAARRNPAWRQLAAVRNRQVYLEPTSPFGWIADPTGVNRLIGLYWLSSLLYPDATQDDLRATTCSFYDKFYRIKLTNARLEALVRPAGAATLAAPRPVGGPLVGLGAPPPADLSASRGGRSTTSGTQGAMPGGMSDMSMATGGPNDPCTVPGAPSPQPLPGTMSAPGASSPEAFPPAAPPGVPPPGRRGRPLR
ncbi:MAG TPA: ABC transporter substrate-binding protein [Stellaceae bacterium]|nr:ABC transporter substrate-binding protein [Stellaceae bacterium]